MDIFKHIVKEYRQIQNSKARTNIEMQHDSSTLILDICLVAWSVSFLLIKYALRTH
jgi:hypothetical protein